MASFVPDSAPEAQGSVSAIGRIFRVLFSPKATFEDIVRKPSWALPAALLGFLGLVVAAGVNQKINWREFIRQQIENNPQTAQQSEERKQQQIEAGAKIAPITAYAGPLIAIVLMLVVALIMWGAYYVMAGVNPGYATALAIVSHAFVPVICGNILLLIVLLLKPPGTLDLNNPVATNLAAFLPEDVPKWLEALGKSLDILILWTLLLMAVGFAAANPKKLKGGRSYRIAFGVFAMYVFFRVGIAFVFS